MVKEKIKFRTTIILKFNDIYLFKRKIHLSIIERYWWKNEKYGRFYDTWSCYTIFPNGKLKLNTVIGGK